MANELVTTQELALWSQTDQATVDADPFAAEVLSKVSDYVRFVAGQDITTWTYDTAPFDAKLIALWMARRTYVNPDQEKTTGTGPISSTVVDAATLAMNLSDEERKTLEGYRGDQPTGLWTMSMGGDGSTILKPTVYVSDDSGSDWEIPYLDINDVAVQDGDLSTVPYPPE